MLTIANVAGYPGPWIVQEVLRGSGGKPVWSEARTEEPPSLQGDFTLEEAFRVALCNLHPGENMIIRVGPTACLPATSFFIAPDDVRVVIGSAFVGPCPTVAELARACAEQVRTAFRI